MIRNAGGRVSEDAIRSLAISQRLLGTKEVCQLPAWIRSRSKVGSRS